MGLDVAPDELIHADRHGAVAIPEAVLPDLATAIARLIETERLIIEPARRFEFEAFEAAWCALE